MTHLRGYKADAVLIPEPEDEKLVRANVGVLWFQIEVRGVPVHVREDDERSRCTATIAIVSLHHVGQPLAESCAHLAGPIDPGGMLVVDELDVGRYDERVTTWWLHQRRAARPRGPPRRRTSSTACAATSIRSPTRPRGARAPLRSRRARARPVPAPLAPPARLARDGGAPDRRGSPARDRRPDGRRQ